MGSVRELQQRARSNPHGVDLRATPQHVDERRRLIVGSELLLGEIARARHSFWNCSIRSGCGFSALAKNDVPDVEPTTIVVKRTVGCSNFHTCTDFSNAALLAAYKPIPAHGGVTCADTLEKNTAIPSVAARCSTAAAVTRPAPITLVSKTLRQCSGVASRSSVTTATPGAYTSASSPPRWSMHSVTTARHERGSRTSHLAARTPWGSSWAFGIERAAATTRAPSRARRSVNAAPSPFDAPMIRTRWFASALASTRATGIQSS